jgi:hypothetical protein
MRKRISWLPAIAMLGVLSTPAFARGGAGGSGTAPASSAFFVHGSAYGARTFARNHVARRITVPNSAFIARNFGIRNDLRFRQRNQLQDVWPIGAWPYSWPMDTAPVTVDGGLANPSVIVISAAPSSAPERTGPQTPPDYSYVPGCHAVPNGYHCDVSSKAEAKP